MTTITTNQESPGAASLPQIDVIIRSPGHSERLDVCLRSLARQEGVVLHPIIVVTRKGVTFPPHVEAQVTFVHDTAEPFNYSRALNVGIARGTSPLVLSFSSHCELMTTHVVSDMAAYFEDEQVVAASCETPNAKSEDWVKQSQAPSMFFTTVRTFNGTNGLSNPCGMIRRTDWEERPFQEDIATAEDHEWAIWALRRTDGKAVYLRGRTVSHNHAYCLEKLWRERLVVASRVHAPLASWRSILREAKQSAMALLRGDRKKLLLHLGYAVSLAGYRITGWTPTQSAYGMWRKSGEPQTPSLSR